MSKTYMCCGAVLLILIAASLGGCGDDSSDDGDAGSSGTSATGGGGGTGGSGGSGGGGSGGTSGTSGTSGGSGGMGGSGGTGGAGGGMPITEAECVTMTNTAMPDVPETCAPCLCGVDTGVAQCNANCWALIGCASAACGALPQAEQQSCVTAMCTAQISAPGAPVGASELGAALMSCSSECGGGSDADAGN